MWAYEAGGILYRNRRCHNNLTKRCSEMPILFAIRKMLIFTDRGHQKVAPIRKTARFTDSSHQNDVRPFVGRFNFQYWFCGRGTQQAEQPLGWAAQLAENRWLAYLPAVVPCYTLFLSDNRMQRHLQKKTLNRVGVSTSFFHNPSTIPWNALSCF